MGGGTPFTNQVHFRFRTDAETVDATPTWGSTEDQATYIPALDTAFRVRFTVENTGTTNMRSSRSLYYSLNGGAYVSVTTTSSVVRAVDAGASADGDAIATQRLTSATGTWVNGEYDESGATSNFNLVDGNFTEFEYGIQVISADVSEGSNVALRIYNSSSPMDNYAKTPLMTRPAARRRVIVCS